MIRALQEQRLTADDFWFNGREQITPATRSARQGDALSKLIPDDKRNRTVDGRALEVGDTGPPELPLPGGATAVLLSPTRERLTKLLAKWPQPTRGADADLDDLLRAFDEEPDRGPGEFGQDSSVPNGSSIAFLFEHAGISVLLTGDAWNSVLIDSIKALLARRNETQNDNDRQAKLRVQIFKLSHHGSRQNITDELLDLIEPEQILICTDGSKFRHPDADALGLLRDHYRDVPILFTDATEVIRERARQIGVDEPSTSPTLIELVGFQNAAHAADQR